MKKEITVLGAGSWGTTLALVLNENGHQVTLWEFFKEDARRIISEMENKKFLPGVLIPETIKVTSDIQEAAAKKDMLVMAVPSHVMREVAQSVNEVNSLGNPIVVNVAKGIENNTLMLMSDVLMESINRLNENDIVILSGPSHAEEVSRKIPTAIVMASTDQRTAEKAQQFFMSPYFRVYTSTDVIGVQLGGSLKNIIAIAAGICDGVGLGDNTKAALLTRGLSEMSRLASNMGAQPITFAGLTGMGDLIVLCTYDFSIYFFPFV